MRHLDYDLAVISEARTSFPHEDQVCSAGPMGGWLADDEHKIIAWSRWGWDAIEEPPDRARLTHIVIGFTDTSAGPIRVVAVTIPYRMFSVQYQLPGMAPARQWEEHEQFIAAIEPVLAMRDLPLVVAGDFNQRIPPSYIKESAAARLGEALDGLTIPTTGLADVDGKQLVCHVATTCAVASVEVVTRFDSSGQLTDHPGAIVTLA